ncbi:hypothetical protein [Paraburkholderia guartelaensis]|uniref:hypothetical protein n=1 Tax=Paraburkholderia guartelaensis TaxID=2546446 RepID=UPI002AB66BB8|nr:hypothetical protein [Paraburkholderia guartelaensis]
MGERASRVSWIVGDIAQIELPIRAYVMRYSADALHGEFGAPFTLLKQVREEHHTPGGATQKFIYCMCRKETS